MQITNNNNRNKQQQIERMNEVMMWIVNHAKHKSICQCDVAYENNLGSPFNGINGHPVHELVSIHWNISNTLSPSPS